MRFRILLLSMLAVCPLSAHDFQFTDTDLILKDETFQLTMICDLDALALGAPLDEDAEILVTALRKMTPEEMRDAEERLNRLFERRVRMRFDGEAIPFEIAFPQYGKVEVVNELPTVFGVEAVLTGSVPKDSKELEFFASRAFPDIRLTIQGPEGVAEPLVIPRGQTSESIDLLNLLQPAPKLTVAMRYLKLGFWHIIPEGLDHILFVLGLFLFCLKLKPLIWQVTAFTIAHTVTLGLSTYEIVSLPSKPVEILIAASIVYIAVENMFTDKLKPHRILIVFAFGLLHGLGFAGVLGELGIPRSSFFTALLSFNIGVEIGQLAVIAIAFACVGWFRERDWYRERVIIPISVLIGVTGLFWVVERILG